MSERTQQALADVMQYLDQQGAKQLGAVLKEVELRLLDRWPEAADPVQRQQMRDAHRWMSRNRVALGTDVLERVRTALAQPRASSVAGSSFKDLSYLTLMESKGLDLGMVRINAISQLATETRAIQSELEGRFEAMNVAAPSVYAQALSAETWVDTLALSSTQLGATAIGQAMITEAFGDLAGAVLRALQAEINSRLAKHEFVPELKITRVNTLKFSDKMTPAQMARTIESRLKVMEDDIADLPGDGWRPGHLRQVVERHFNADTQAALTAVQRKAVEQLEASFLSMIANHDISLRFRGQLNRLVLPMLVLRLATPKVLEDPHSPIRAFIQQLAILGSLDNMDAMANFDSVISVVDRIVLAEGGDIERFRSGSQALYTLLHSVVLDDIGHAGESLAEPIRVRAEQAVQEDLQRTALGRNLPPAAQRVLTDLLVPWMVTCYEVYGEDSKAGISALVSAQLFFDAVGPAGPGVAEIAHQNLREDILAEARDWASQSSLPVAERKTLLADLQTSFGFLN